jgi:hypothetical protein
MRWLLLLLILPRLLKGLVLVVLGLAAGIFALRMLHIPMSPCMALLVPPGLAIYFIAVMYREWPDTSSDGSRRARRHDADS